MGKVHRESSLQKIHNPKVHIRHIHPKVLIRIRNHGPSHHIRIPNRSLRNHRSRHSRRSHISFQRRFFWLDLRCGIIWTIIRPLLRSV